MFKVWNLILYLTLRFRVYCFFRSIHFGCLGIVSRIDVHALTHCLHVSLEWVRLASKSTSQRKHIPIQLCLLHLGNHWTWMPNVFLMKNQTSATFGWRLNEDLIHRGKDLADFEFCQLGGIGIPRVSGWTGFRFQTFGVQRVERSAGVFERV